MVQQSVEQAESPTVEHSTDLDDKHVLKHMVESALSYLQRSLAIMIKSSMSRLYGTKEILQQLQYLKSELQRSPEQSKEWVEKKQEYDDIIVESCKL